MGDETKAPAKAGYKSTEFWLSLVAVLAGFILASGIGGDASEGEKPSTTQTVAGVVLTALGALGYTKGRTAVKVAEETKKAEASKIAGYLAIAKEKLEEFREGRATAEAERDKAAAELEIKLVDAEVPAATPVGTGG